MAAQRIRVLAAGAAVAAGAMVLTAVLGSAAARDPVRPAGLKDRMSAARAYQSQLAAETTPALNADQGSASAGGTCAPHPDDDPDTWICEAETACAPARGSYWVRHSAEYQALVDQTFHFASLRALQLGQERAPGTWAVVVDLDETVLSNAPYNYERERCGRGYSRASWADWSRAQQATLLPGATAFADLVYAQGGLVVGVTNRRESEGPWTAPILEAGGFQHEFVLYRGDAEGATGEKEARFEAVPALLAERGYADTQVVIYMGDQITDFPDLDQMSFPDGIDGPFGISYFVLPNPMYGSWESGGH